MTKGNRKVGFFITFLLLGFMFLCGKCVVEVKPTKEQIRIDSVEKIDTIKADTLPSTLKGKSK